MKKLTPVRISFFSALVAIAFILASGKAVAQPTCNADDIFVGNFLGGTVVRFSKTDIAANGSASASTVIGSGLGAVEGMTLDFDGTVIVTTRFNNTVYRFDRTGTPNCAIATINSVEGPTFDAAGNLFVNDNTTPSITYKAPPVGGCPSTLSPVPWINTYPAGTFTEDTRISPSTAPVFPSSLYILGSFGGFTNPNSIQAWSPTTANMMLGTVISDFGAATVPPLGAGAYQSLGMAFDSQGDIWIADFSGGAGAGRLLEFNSAGSFKRMVTIPGSSQQQVKIAISSPNPADPLNPNNNTIYVTDLVTNNLYILDEVTGSVLFTLPSNLNGPSGVAVCDVIVQPPTTGKCPLTQGFWKNHPDAWPVTSLTLGCETYTQAELLAILTTPIGKGGVADASLILADQLIAAKLSIANGSNPTPISATIAAADALLCTFSGKLPYHVKPSSIAGQQMTALAATLDQYNSGLLTPDCTP